MATNYQKGASKERRIINKAIKEGKEAFRSAGSHSDYDYVILDWENRTVTFGQAKTGKFYANLKDGSPNSIMRPLLEQFEEKNNRSKGEWSVNFEVK